MTRIPANGGPHRMHRLGIGRLSALIVTVAITAGPFGLAQAAEAGDPSTAKSATTHHRKAAPARHKVIVPKSSIEKPGDVGKRAHTNYEILDTHGPVTLPSRSRKAPPDAK